MTVRDLAVSSIDQVAADAEHVTTCESCGFSRPCQIDGCDEEHAGYAVVRGKRRTTSPVLLCGPHLDRARGLAAA